MVIMLVYLGYESLGMFGKGLKEVLSQSKGNQIESSDKLIDSDLLREEQLV